MEVIAEGVETAQQAQSLHRLGCRLVQGHLFSVAVEAGAVAGLLSRDTAFPFAVRALIVAS